MSQLRSRQRGKFPLFHLLFYSGVQWIGWEPLMLARPSARLNLPIQMLISSRGTLTDTGRIMCDQISGHTVAKSGWHIKLSKVHGGLQAYLPLGWAQQHRTQSTQWWELPTVLTTAPRNGLLFSKFRDFIVASSIPPCFWTDHGLDSVP